MAYWMLHEKCTGSSMSVLKNKIFTLYISYRHNAAICYRVKTWVFGIIHCSSLATSIIKKNTEIAKILLLNVNQTSYFDYTKQQVIITR